jgi:hypothetical protein
MHCMMAIVHCELVHHALRNADFLYSKLRHRMAALASIGAARGCGLTIASSPTTLRQPFDGAQDKAQDTAPG